jgi:tetratricopeptide (TPR) repeat protein
MAADNKAKILRDAEKNVSQGRIPQAIAEYQKVIKLDPNDVLILNTIGDLYLRQGKVTEANQHFLQVADTYVRNNFLLKALAVYKKILNSDPQNYGMCQIMAGLYAMQGLNVDARIHYLKAAEIALRQGRTREATQAYEKVVEVDPGNFTVQLKLAEIKFAEGDKDKAFECYTAAAKAQVKAGNLAAALKSYKQALALRPLDAAILRGFYETSVAAGTKDDAIAQIDRSLALDPDNIEILEMSGYSRLFSGNIKEAAAIFDKVVQQDESRLRLMFEIHDAYVAAKDLNSAASCLDPYMQRFAAQRMMDRVIQANHAALTTDPFHIVTLRRLEDIFSSINDHSRRLEILDRLAQVYLDRGEPNEALTCLESILLYDYGSRKHQEMHREAFQRAFPNKKYSPPLPGVGGVKEVPSQPVRTIDLDLVPDAGTGSMSLVEIDLLINYQMTDRALEVLRSMHQKNSGNPEMLTRLISLLRDKDAAAAADYCMTLALVYRGAGDDIEAGRWRAEAESLDKGAASRRAREWEIQDSAVTSGIDESGQLEAVGGEHHVEVDLSGDLSDIFFTGSGEDAGMGTAEIRPASDESIEEFTPAELPNAAGSSLSDQLQEVDFYIRLGFLDEAKSRLDEIVKEHGKIPEAASRYSQLSGTETAAEPKAEMEFRPVSRTASQPFSGEAAAGEDTEPLELELQDLDTETIEQETWSGPKAEEEPPVIALGPPAYEPAPQESGAGVIALGPPAGTSSPPPDTEVIALGPPAGLAAKSPSEKPASSGPGMPLAAGIQETTGKPGAEPTHLHRIETEHQGGSVFDDLLEEVKSINDQEIAWEDFETFFNLGTAYREMGLLDDAIREFQGAVKALDPHRHPREVIQCCGMLSTCFLGKQMPRSAMRWCDAGLSVSDISEHEIVALRYDMGIAFALSGDKARALSMFEFVYGLDPAFRDVAQKIDELKSGSPSNAS